MLSTLSSTNVENCQRCNKIVVLEPSLDAKIMLRALETVQRSRGGRLNVLRKNADCQFFHGFVRIGYRQPSLHDKGEEKLEIIVARTDTEGCHATHNNLLHVLLDVTSRLCNSHRRSPKNETWRFQPQAVAHERTSSPKSALQSKLTT